MEHSAAIAAVFLGVLGCAQETELSNTDDGGDQQVGNGLMEFSPEQIEFKDLEQGITRSVNLTIYSKGENALMVYEVRILNSGEGVFYVEEKEDLSLAPDTEAEFPVTASMSDWAKAVEGSLRVKTNDPDALTVEIPLIGYPAADFYGETGDSTL